MFRKRKTFKEPDLNWQNFYTSFLQVSLQNYSLEEVFNISIPYFEYLIYEDDVLKSCLTYEYSIISNKNDMGSIIKGNKYLSLLFDNFLKYEEMNKLINFYSIKNVIEDMELDKKLTGYVYEDLEIDIQFLNTKIEYFYKDSTENDKNRKLSEWNYFGIDKFYKLFIKFMIKYYEKLNEEDIFKMSSDFLKFLEEKEEYKLETLEKNFEEYFNKTLLEEKNEWN